MKVKNQNKQDISLGGHYVEAMKSIMLGTDRYRNLPRAEEGMGSNTPDPRNDAYETHSHGTECHAYEGCDEVNLSEETTLGVMSATSNGLQHESIHMNDEKQACEGEEGLEKSKTSEAKLNMMSDTSKVSHILNHHFSSGHVERQAKKRGWVHFLFCFLLVLAGKNQSFVQAKAYEVSEEGNVEDRNVVNLNAKTGNRSLSNCEDAKGKIRFASTDRPKNCNWVGQTGKKEVRCELPEAKENCRKTCGLCNEDKETPAPVTSAPVTSTPVTLAPSKLPVSSISTNRPSVSLPTTNNGKQDPNVSNGGQTKSPPSTKDSVTRAPVTSVPVTLAPSKLPVSSTSTNRPSVYLPTTNGKQDPNVSNGGHTISPPSTSKGKGKVSLAPGKGKGKGKGSPGSVSCKDEPNWKVAGIIEESGLEPFEGMTCDEIRDEIEEDQFETWCNFHKFSTEVGKSAFEACCFCGGGSHIRTPCEDFTDWSMNPSSANNLANCPFIENVKEPTSFCNRIKMHKGLGGLTAGDACCVCGGGYRPVYTPEADIDDDQCSSDNFSRRLNDDGYTNYNRNDYHYHTKLGDSPGIPNLEYLGLGYDGLRGNPRGSTSSEIDPGFRSRVFALLQSQDKTSVDFEYVIPLGTDFKYTSSCHYDDRSVEISSSQDYSEVLSTEADMSSGSSSSSSRTETYNKSFDFGFSAIFPVKGLFVGLGGSLSYGNSGSEFSSNAQSQAFQKSEKFSSFSSTSRTESSVSFEAKAVCSEFEIQFNEYDSHTLDPRFEYAMNCLPDHYESGNLANEVKFAKFISNYGTHYTRKVVLGAKRILTTTMSSNSVAELNRRSVDIASTLSVQMQEAMSKTSSERFGASVAATVSAIPKAANVPELKFSDGSSGFGIGGGDDPSPVALTINNNMCEDKDDDDESEDDGDDDSKKASGSASLAYTSENSETNTSESSENLSSFARNNKQSESANTISQKTSRTTEVNIGGSPKSNWREWAESVKDKPMPISYELVGLWNLMSGKKARAFFEAFKDIEGVDISPKEPKPLLDAMHFGVSNGLGEPFSPYTQDPNADYRALLRTEQIDESIDEIKVLDILGSTSDIDATDLGEYFGCGIDWEKGGDGKNEDESIGLKAMALILCNIHSPSDVRRLGNPLARFSKCPSSHFITGFSIQSESLQGNLVRDTKARHNSDWSFKAGDSTLLSQNFLYGVEMECQRLDGTNPVRIKIFESPEDIQWSDMKRLPKHSKKDVRIGITSMSIKSQTHHVDFVHKGTPDYNNQNRRYYSDIYQLSVSHKLMQDSGSTLENGALTYSTTWKGKRDKPIALFSTPIQGNSIGRDHFEESKLGFLDVASIIDATHFMNGVPFGLSHDYLSSGILAMSHFNKRSKALHNFSFLTVDDLSVNRDKIRVGIVSDAALLLNNDNKVEVNRVGKTTFSVLFTDKQAERPVSPIIIASPHWYTKSKTRYPTGVGQISLALIQNSSWDNGFHVALGSVSNQSDKLNGMKLGFNFVAFDSNLDNTNIKVGYVNKNDVQTPQTKTSSCKSHIFSESQCLSIGVHDDCCFWDGFECLPRDGGLCSTGSNSFEVEWSSLFVPKQVTSYEFCEVLFNDCAEDSPRLDLEVDGTEGIHMARVKFNEAFEAIPAVVLTPVLSSSDDCRSFSTGFGSGNGNLGQELGIPHCVVDTIEKHSFAAKCGCLRSIAGDKPRLEFRNIPFNFVATGPEDEEQAMKSTEWRLTANNLKYWEMARLQMFSHSKVLEPRSVFASNHIDGTFPCNVMNGNMHWKGSDKDGPIYIGFEFNYPEKVTKVLFHNHSNSKHPSDVQLQALFNGKWEDVASSAGGANVSKLIDAKDSAWNSVMVLPKAPALFTNPDLTISPSEFPTSYPSAVPSDTPTRPDSNLGPKSILNVKVADVDNSGNQTNIDFRISGSDGDETSWVRLRDDENTFKKGKTFAMELTNTIVASIGNPKFIDFRATDKNTTLQVDEVSLEMSSSKYVAVIDTVIKQPEGEANGIIRREFDLGAIPYIGRVSTCKDDGTDADIQLIIYGRTLLDDGTVVEKNLEVKFHGDSAGYGAGIDLSLNQGDDEYFDIGYEENIGDLFRVKLKNKGGGGFFGRDDMWAVNYIEINNRRFNFNCERLNDGDELTKEIW